MTVGLLTKSTVVVVAAVVIPFVVSLFWLSLDVSTVASVSFRKARTKRADDDDSDGAIWSPCSGATALPLVATVETAGEKRSSSSSSSSSGGGSGRMGIVVV